MIHSDPGYLRPPSPLTAKHFSSHIPYDIASSVCYRCAITLEVARRQGENQSRLQAPGGIPPAWREFRVTPVSDLRLVIARRAKCPTNSGWPANPDCWLTGHSDMSQMREPDHMASNVYESDRRSDSYTLDLIPIRSGTSTQVAY